MATTPKRQIGTMACLCCGQEIPVKAAENNTISAPCAWCDFPAYAKAGTEAHRIIMGKLKNQPKQAPALEHKAPAATKTVAAPTPAPEPRRASTIFELGSSAT